MTDEIRPHVGEVWTCAVTGNYWRIDRVIDEQVTVTRLQTRSIMLMTLRAAESSAGRQRPWRSIRGTRDTKYNRVAHKLRA